MRSYHVYKRPFSAKFRIDPASRMPKPSKRQIAAWLATYMLPLLLLDFVTVKRYHGAVIPAEDLRRWVVTERRMPMEAPSTATILTHLALSLVIYDVIFALLHYALHKSAPLYKRLHSTHHEHGAIDTSVTLKMEIAERVVTVLAANESLKLLKAHPLTRSLFVFIFIFLLVENHSGLDFPYMYDKVRHPH